MGVPKISWNALGDDPGADGALSTSLELNQDGRLETA